MALTDHIDRALETIDKVLEPLGPTHRVVLNLCGDVVGTAPLDPKIGEPPRCFHGIVGPCPYCRDTGRL